MKQLFFVIIGYVCVYKYRAKRQVLSCILASQIINQLNIYLKAVAI